MCLLFDPQCLAFKRAAEAEKARQRRNDVKASFVNTGVLALACARYIVAGEIARAWEHFGGFGALLANLAHLVELSIGRNMGTASLFERA